jgi:hypothetical protein
MEEINYRSPIGASLRKEMEIIGRKTEVFHRKLTQQE